MCLTEDLSPTNQKDHVLIEAQSKPKHQDF